MDFATLEAEAGPDAEPERDLNAEQKKRRWGHEKGWAWLTRERLEAMCLHPRQVLVRVFFGRRVRVLYCRKCKRRAILRKGRRGVARVSQPDVVIEVKPWRLKP